MTLPLGGLLLGGLLNQNTGNTMPILILSADPTVTPTAGAQTQFGTFGGNLYLHMTVATDTAWLQLQGLVRELVNDFASLPAPLTRPQGSLAFARDGSNAWLLCGGQWVDLDFLGVLYGSAGAGFGVLLGLMGVQDPLHRLAVEYATILQVTRTMLSPLVATGLLTFPEDVTALVDNDGWIFPALDKSPVRIEVQRTGGYVVTPGVTFTVDARTFTTWDELRAGVLPLIGAHTGVGVTEQSHGLDYQASLVALAAGAAWNIPLVQTFSHAGFALTGLVNGADSLFSTMVRRQSFVVSYTDFLASNDTHFLLTLSPTFPANAILVGATMHVDAIWSAPGLSAITLELDNQTNGTASVLKPLSGLDGEAESSVGRSPRGGPLAFVTCTARTVGANLNTFIAGSVEIEIQYVVAP